MKVEAIRVKGGVQISGKDGRIVFIQLKDAEELAFDLQRIARKE